MPLDRIITVNLQSEGERVEGKYVDGALTPYRVWAERISSGATDEASEGIGTVTQAIVTWRIRFRELFAMHRVDLMSIEAEGFSWNVEAVNQSDERRRYLELRSAPGRPDRCLGVLECGLSIGAKRESRATRMR